MEFKEKLCYVRALLNLTQTQLAEELNVSFVTLNRWESGKFKPSKKGLYSFNIFCEKKGIKFDE